MSISLQRANFWKRISAYMLDMVLAVMLTLGVASFLSFVFQYDKYTDKLASYYTEYEETYQVDFDISEETLNSLSQAEKDNFTAASNALGKDPRVLKAYDSIFYRTLAIISLSVFFAQFAVYFIPSLFFKNGQTLGKKIFGLAVMRTNCVKVSYPVLFIRAMLGLCTIETLVPVLFIVMILFGLLGVVGWIALLLLLLLQIFVMVKTPTNSSIHDLLADTVVVDYASQQIFESQEELIAFKEEEHRREVESMRETEPVELSNKE